MSLIIKFNKQADWLLFIGFMLILLGLLIGLFIPILSNPRMGLSAHLEGIMNGFLLVILGLIWDKIWISFKWLNIAFYLVLYGAFANFIAVVLAAITGAGKMMPIAGGKEGPAATEIVISFLLISLAIAMITVCIIVLIGLKKYLSRPNSPQ
jgi:hydroxylaminobenzene mutase